MRVRHRHARRDRRSVVAALAITLALAGCVGPAGRPGPTAAHTFVGSAAAGADIAASNRAAVDLFGRAGALVDLHADVDNTQLFGGAAGNFGLGPERNLRIAAVAFDGGLLLVLVLAPPGEVEEAWARVQPILASITLPT